MYMNYIHSFIRKIFLVESSDKFVEKRFKHNNLCILSLSIYLMLEQLYYGLSTSEFGSLKQKIFILSALLMMGFTLISGFIYIKRIKKLFWVHKIYEISFGLVGFIIAIARSLILQNNTFALPSIYIAVIYGFAVFFYFSPVISFGIYFITCTLIIILLPMFHPDIIRITFVQDIVTNNIIAWIASVINYQRYVKEYKSQQIICNKNEELQAKTDNIQKTNQVLQYISSVDELTNIYNRRKLNESLKIEYERCKALHRKISLIIMDVDFFKLVNDTYGHSIGDKVLEQLGELLKKNVRQNDKVGRWGGEEFLIICPKTNFEEAFNLAEKIRNCIQNHDFEFEYNVTCSFGVATNKDIDTITSLIVRADKGLYKAKAFGRNRVEEGEK